MLSNNPTNASSPFSSSRTARAGSSNLFAPARPSQLSRSLVNGHVTGEEVEAEEGAGSSVKVKEKDTDALYLQPSVYRNTEKGKWRASGETALAAVSPVGGEIASWFARKDTADKPRDHGLNVPHNQIYFSASNNLPDAVTSFYRETYTLFTSLQRIVSSAMRIPRLDEALQEKSFNVKEAIQEGDILVAPSAETIGHMGRLVGLYLGELQKLRESQILEALDRTTYEAVYHILHLAQILYLPRDGRGEGLLGEELLDWVNDVDPAPPNQQGNEIMQSRPPWDHPAFWPYVCQCMLRGFHLPASSFLRTLVDHPDKSISDLASLLSSHLSRFPRSTNVASYPLDHQFLSAHRQWLSTFRAELTTTLKGRTRGKWFEGEEISDPGSWERDFKSVVELMEGKPERVLAEASDWREALGAWGVLVDVNLRRDDLATIAADISSKIPMASPVTVDDSIEYSLCIADVPKALSGCHDLDKWLAAHLGDIFDKLGLLLDDEDRFELSIRDYFLLDYADVLCENPESNSLWRVICDYLSAAGPEGRRRLKEFILHVSLDILDPSNIAAGDTDMDGMDDFKDEDEDIDLRVRKYAQIQEACEQLGLPDEARTISRIMAGQLLKRGELGIAATMCLQAEEGNTLSLITEQILDAYIAKGEEEYLRLVDSLPPTLLTEAPLALQHFDPNTDAPLDFPGQTSATVFTSRLTFLSEFRDYLLFTMQDARDRAAQRLVNLLTANVAPVRFWAVILAESVPLLEDAEVLFNANDTFELMRVLEDVESNAIVAPDMYLGDLVSHLRRKQEQGQGEGLSLHGGKASLADARTTLDQVRLALARNLARAMVMDFDTPF
ncbi:Nup85 nucleoporin-domain-containing protein [Kockovaella imperatae]|uniref:Nuclear pore complex protein Nup85 n=1 Tax=Kockovaella imperatae TaxID=4999 RepID=A0A1Y1U7B1_9TREE|nr:Nup85 nucleoporin-domain-containing protein [Kockovaella imperatae]ORX33416.1 Nup85 nucleoporin-domain-containing protein [Kockovaella imperatae]